MSEVTIATQVVKFFAEKLGAKTDEDVNNLVKSFMDSTATKTSATQKKTLVKRASTTSVASTASASIGGACGNCAYMIKKKTGELEVCNKNAKNELDGKFYCGSVDKAGHYQTTLKANAKKNPDVPPLKRASTVTTSTASSRTTTTAKTGSGTNAGTLSVLEKLKQRNNNGADAVFKVEGTEFYIFRENRVLMNIKTKEAYGILGDDNKTVKNLTPEAIAFLKQKNIFYTNNAKGQEDLGEEDAVVEEVEEEVDVDEEDEDEEDDA